MGAGLIRVVLVDDQELVRSGLRGILLPRYGFDVVGECDDGAGVVGAVERLRPDVVVMDIRMKVVDGVEATRRVRDLDDGPPVLVLTTYDDDEVLSAALRVGAAGFALKDAPGEELHRAVRAVAEGEAWLDPAVTGRVLAAYRAQGRDARSPELQELVDRLTAREVEVLQLMARGATNAEIAAGLFVGEGTVKTHIGHIFSKLHLRDRAAAIVFAYDCGLVEPRA